MTLKKKHVLVIDDDDDVRSFLQSLLESEGFEVSAAADGREGLECQRRNPAHVVLTDIFMPGKEGIETIYELRKEFPDAGIIVMSGGGSIRGVDYLSVAKHIGAARSLNKPFDPEDLLEAVREVGGLTAPLE
jgi:DNA-binding NtrC family response regulator